MLFPFVTRQITLERVPLKAKFSLLEQNLSGLLPAELVLYQDYSASLLCPRPLISSSPSLFKFFARNPLPQDTELALSLEKEGVFELWSAKIDRFLGFKDGKDEYELKDLYLTSSSSQRKSPRIIVQLPLKLKDKQKDLKRIFFFRGGEFSREGLALWFPKRVAEIIEMEQILALEFELANQQYNTQIKCIRPHYQDHASDGLIAGFVMLEKGIGEVILEKEPVSSLHLRELWEGEFSI